MRRELLRANKTNSIRKLDIDVVLAAQALTLGVPFSDLIMATGSVSHIPRFAPADLWNNIRP